MGMPEVKASNKAVGAAEQTKAVVFATDEDGGGAAFPAGVVPRVTITPLDPWVTSFRVVVATNTGFTANFGAVPGGYGGSFDWIAIGRVL